ncbi:type VI secretion system-associated protein VasI [Enterovibrio coralii]|nr:type VI secretion system-associated protein VasI [Enterovibrio coralii]
MSLFTPVFSYAVEPTDKRIEQARVCTTVANRLARLSCFDGVFDTPVGEQMTSQFTPEKAPSWHLAKQSEAKRGEREEGLLLNQADAKGEASEVWLTSSAISTDSTFAPILVLSCVDDISRVELAVTNSINVGRVTITTYAQGSDTRAWTSDESGYVLSAGRGLPAIELMKSMLNASTVFVRSNHKEVTEARFDISNIRSVIKPLRKSCGW